VNKTAVKATISKTTVAKAQISKGAHPKQPPRDLARKTRTALTPPRPDHRDSHRH
jgi:hypothetical protein